MRKYAIWIVLGLLVLWTISSYNSLISSRENVNTAWSNVENQYQRRSDLIPNLVNTVKGVANFEQSTLVAVTQARANATGIKVDANNLTTEKMQQFQEAQGQLTGALSRLLVTVEKYPELKATENFSALQAQLEGTENRINEVRRMYNDAAKDYNVGRSRFPAVIIANLAGFKDRPYFEADKGAEKVPEVKF
mgnify:FL=1